MSQLEIRFWGVRGSIASPGEATTGVGGNTSCVEVRAGDTRIILDAGTGLRGLGDAWMKDGPVDATLLLSHLHWDHIQGIPFFTPLYLPTTRLRVVGQGTTELSLRDALAQQMQPPTFPVRWEDLPSRVEFQEIQPGRQFRVGDAQVRAARLNHPGGGVIAYRIEWAGRALVFATDTEHYSCVDPTLLALAEDADVLIYDSQYTPEEYRGEVGPARVGWGHSTFRAGAELAEAARVGRYVLFHHDPARSDDDVAAIEARAKACFPDSEAAREGRTLTLCAQ
ncbi:MAG: MBL fold metallo-hydrolase [Myxococcota bacterium]